MAVFPIVAPSGRAYLWDPDGMYIAIRSVARANYIKENSRIVEEDQGWFLPTLYNMETRWNGIRAAVNQASETYWPEAEMQTRTDADNFFNTFVAHVESGLSDQQWYEEGRRGAQERSMRNISNNVDNWETALTVTRGIRDGSATFLIVAGGVATGGTGWAALSAGQGLTAVAAGSAMRGAFTYQDTGNVGSAVLNATGSFIVGAIPVAQAGMSLQAAETATLVIIGAAGQGTTTGLQSLVEGNDVSTAATAAIVSTAGGVLTGGMGARLEGAGFFLETTVGTAMDLATNAAVGQATSPSPQQQRVVAVPRTLGRIDFASVPSGGAERYVRETCLRPI